MDFIARYIKGKNDKGSIVYACDQLKEILEPTYGCIVYQEQVMQIVRDLAGYTMGRSDLVRRAMSKKKTSVMEQERKNFVYGSEEEGVLGCINNGISESVANHIFDEMTDFAKYAFNKSHAACYAVVAYQTAYLKYYYPKEFMAAIMTSVMDNTTKVSEYILTCKQMGIPILPPDINEGESGFSVSGEAIRYGLSAIKSVGRNVVDAIVAERELNGHFVSMENFVDRMSNKEVNKRTLENFIKAGALDSMPGNRRQKVMIAPELLEQKNRERKHNIAGQLTLFDFALEEEKEQFQITLPKVEEFGKQELFGFEKETLGVYLTGHPMEAYESQWQKYTTAKTTDFIVDEETEEAKVKDNTKVIVGGMITSKTIKTTRNGQQMAFLQLEDMVGTIEIVVFPKDFANKRHMMDEDAKVLVEGRVSIADEPIGKMILESIILFEEIPKDLWIKFSNKETFSTLEQDVMNLLKSSDGNDYVIIYLEEERAKKVLPSNWTIRVDSTLINRLELLVGKNNVKVVEKGLKR